MKHDEEHIKRVRDSLANDGTETTPDELKSTLETIYAKLGAAVGVTAEQARDIMKREAQIVGVAKGEVLELLEELGPLPIHVIYLVADQDAFGALGMEKWHVDRAVAALEKSGDIIKIGNDYQRRPK